MELIFWASAFLIVYTYFLYPGFLWVIAALCQFRRDLLFLARDQERRVEELKDWELPSITMIIAAHNEEKVIEAKVKNCLELDYPRGKVQFIIGSDASTDATDSIVRRYEDHRLRLIRYSQRSGKVGVLNKTVPLAEGEILVFSDANTMLEPLALKKLVRHFQKKEVGAVCGQLSLVDPENLASGEWFCRHYESLLKLLEGRMGTLAGAHGGIYALRRELFEPIPDDSLVDDFIIPMRVFKKGYKIAYEPGARAFEMVPRDIRAEFRRGVRIAAGNFQNLIRLKSLLNPSRGMVSFCFWSHRVIRWHVPFLMIAAYLSNFFLVREGAVFLGLFCLQMLFYLLGLLGQMKVSKHLFLKGPQYFLLMNAALLVGFLRFLKRNPQGIWTPTARWRPD